MQEALSLFESLLSQFWFEKSAITLLLTKLDLFEEKIKEKPIRDYFPDYTDRSDDSAAGLRFFVGRFLSLSKRRDREIEVFCTDVTDMQRFKPILQTIMDTAIKKKKASSVNFQAPTYVSQADPMIGRQTSSDENEYRRRNKTNLKKVVRN